MIGPGFAVGADGYKILRLRRDTVVGPSDGFLPGEVLGGYCLVCNPSKTGPFVNRGYWRRNNTGFIGLTFQLDGATHYGWASISILKDFEVQLNTFAYETQPNTPISTTGTPEPSSLFLIALGAAGIAVFRRKRNPS